MIDNNTNISSERVFVIEIANNTDNDDKIFEIIEESKSLIESADATFVGEIIVKLREITPATYIGKGKVCEIHEIVKQLNADTVLFDGALSPSQLLNLQEALEVKVIDRTTLILDIFAKRAKTHEGKIQVELAQLNYLYPRLKGKGQALSRLGGGIGTRGPGETQLETDRRHIRTRILNLKKELELLKTRRESQEYRRSKNSEIIVSLVGYTNSGKSTLLNLLTNSNVYSENKLFATLDPTIRKCKLNDFEVLLVDTVGFIRNIPTDLIEAFKSTLEIALFSNLNVVVLDGSTNYETQLNVTNQTLCELKATAPTLVAVNKCDKIENLNKFPKDFVPISAKTGFNINILKEEIYKKLSELFIRTKLKILYNELNEFNKLTEFLESFELDYKNDYVIATVLVKKVFFDKFVKFKK